MSLVPRPFGVTLVGILIVISGIFSVIAAIIGLFDANLRVGVSLISLVLLLIVGLIYLAVAKGIFDGNPFSRLLVAIVTVIGLCVGLIHLIFVAGLRVNGFFQIVFCLIILGLLFSRRATVFFATSE